MREVLFLFLILINLNEVCQCQPVIAEPVDSLKKYSYFIFGTEHGYHNTFTVDPVEFITGTCFFIKTRKQTFLVSAKHLLTSWDGINGGKFVNYPDTLYVNLQEKKSGKYELYPIYIKQIKDTIAGAFLYEDPDAFAIELKDVDRYYINSVENYLTPNIPDSAIQPTAYLYGFPQINNTSIEDLMAMPAIQTKLNLISKLSDVVDLGERRCDAINYRAEIVSGNYKRGNSGSPVFFKTRNNKYWLFGGIASSFLNSLERQILIVKPNDALLKVIALAKD